MTVIRSRNWKKVFQGGQGFSPEVIGNLTQLEEDLAALAVSGDLTPTAVKAADYNAAVGDLVLVDGSAALRTITLPTAPADQSQVGVYNYTFPGSANLVQTGSGDHIREFGGSINTTQFLRLTDEFIVYQYSASAKLWYIVQHIGFVDPSWLYTGSSDETKFLTAANTYVRIKGAIAAAAYSASITPVFTAGQWQTITVTNGTGFAINAPVDESVQPPSASQTFELVIEVRNSSGGAMGVITWDAVFVFAGLAWTNPANGKKRFARFAWNGAAWICTSVAAGDY